jgi:hypothetical protein
MITGGYSTPRKSSKVENIDDSKEINTAACPGISISELGQRVH